MNQTNAMDVAKGALIGALAGGIASWGMEVFQSQIQKLKTSAGVDEPKESTTPSTKPATVQMAEKISRGVLHRELRESEEQRAGELVHYGFGMGLGALYGALAQVYPAIRSGLGLPYGTGVFLVADETAVPLLKLSRPSTEYPVSVHLYSLFSHFVYGAVLSATERGMRRLLDSWSGSAQDAPA